MNKENDKILACFRAISGHLWFNRICSDIDSAQEFNGNQIFQQWEMLVIINWRKCSAFWEKRSIFFRVTLQNSGFTTKILRGGPEIVNIFLGDVKFWNFRVNYFKLDANFIVCEDSDRARHASFLSLFLPGTVTNLNFWSHCSHLGNFWTRSTAEFISTFFPRY